MNEISIPHVTLHAISYPFGAAVVSGIFGVLCGLSMYGFTKLCVDRTVKNTVNLINVQLEANAIVSDN